MLNQPTNRHWILASAALVLTLAGVCVAPMVFAKIIANTINPVAVVTDNGRHILVTGPVGCTAGERAYVRVTVTQRATGAVAEGSTFAQCTGVTEQWEVHASTQGKETFQAGDATAAAIARTTSRGATTDAHQWLVDITLVSE